MSDEEDDEDDEGVGQSPESWLFMWLIYQACDTCGAQAKSPCAGEGVRFGPHEGRKPHWHRP